MTAKLSRKGETYMKSNEAFKETVT